MLRCHKKMNVTFGALRNWAERGPNRIALSTAMRGMIATAAPLIVLPPLGYQELAHLAVIGALGVSLTDVGGPYRRRLVVMAIASILGPSLLIAGLHVRGNWWLGSLLMAVLAVGSGLVRAFGPGGISFGINMAMAFLIGAGTGALGGGNDSVWAGGYFCGAAWTVVVTLAFWHLRPYRRLEQEVAGAWQAVAEFVAAVRTERLSLGRLSAGGQPTRRRGEQIIEARHRAAREAIEAAHDAVGEARAETSGAGMTMAQLVVLVASGSRIGTAAVSLSEIGPAAWDEAALRVSREALEEIETVCRAVAKLLLAGRGEPDLNAVRARVAAVDALSAGAAARDPSAPRPPRAAALAFAQAIRNVENAAEALHILREQRRRLPDIGRLIGALDRGSFVDQIRSHLSFKSGIFRHALRVAAVTSICTGLIVRYDLGHGIWLPMTALVVLQPDYGGTLKRAFQRSAGTVAGSIIASVLLVTLRGTVGFEVAVAALLFATFLLIRRHYGQAMVFLTPLIILLVGFSGPNPWEDVVARVVFTLLGAVVALVAGYVLWPQWERERLPVRLATALRADQAYLAAVLDALAVKPEGDTLGPLRRAAEIEVTNVDAAFQRMVSEPSPQRGRAGKLFMLTVYIHRLCRHTIALEAQTAAVPLPIAVVTPLRALLTSALEDVARALTENRAPGPRPPFDEPLARLRYEIGHVEPNDGEIALTLGKIVSDATALNVAAAAAAAVSG